MTLRSQLRSATEPLHRELERRLPLSRGEIGLDAYRDHLQWLLGFHLTAEDQIFATKGLETWLPDWESRRKVPLLRRDVADSPVPRAELLNLAADDAGSCLGCLYVLEGATLGARTLLPRLTALRVIPGPIGSHYLEGYGPRSGVMWKRFVAALDALPRAAHEPAVQTARETFESLIEWREAWEDL